MNLEDQNFVDDEEAARVLDKMAPKEAPSIWNAEVHDAAYAAVKESGHARDEVLQRYARDNGLDATAMKAAYEVYLACGGESDLGDLAGGDKAGAVKRILRLCEEKKITPPWTYADALEAWKRRGRVFSEVTAERQLAWKDQSSRWNGIVRDACGGKMFQAHEDTGDMATAAPLTAAQIKAEAAPRWFFLARNVIYCGKARDFDGGAWHYVITFKTADGIWKTTTVACSEVGVRKTDWLAYLKDKGAEINDGDMLAAILAADTAPKLVNIVKNTGWQNKRKTIFAMPDGTIIGADESSVLPTFDEREGFGREGTKEKADESIYKLAVGNSRLIGTTTASLAAPFVGLLGIHPGMIHYYGNSGDGKTVSQRVGAAVIGSGSKVYQWASTENGFEARAALHNDLGLPMEELKTGAKPQGVHRVIMLYGNGAGKDRMTKNMGLRQATSFRGFGVSSGERSVRDFLLGAKVAGVTYDGGVASRIADIPSDAGGQFKCFETIHRFASGYAFAKHLEAATVANYGHHLPALLASFLEDPEGNLKEMVQRVQDATALIGLDANENVTRVVDRFALMVAVGEFAAERGVLPWPRGEAERGVMKLVEDWKEARGESGTKTEAITGLRELECTLAVHGARIQSKKDRNEGRVVHNCLGYSDHDESGERVIYMSRDQLTEVVGGPERVNPVLDHVKDGKGRFGLKVSKGRGRDYATPRHFRDALDQWCYAIVVREEWATQAA